MRRAAPAALAAAIVAATGCKGTSQAPPAPLVVSYDLARMAVVADREGPPELTRFGTPAAGRYEGEGFVQPAETGDGEPFVWARRTAEIRLSGRPTTPRRVVVEMASYPGLKRQAAAVFLNERRIGRIALGEKRRRYLLTIPPQPEAKENRLRFAFDRGSPKVAPYRRSLAAAFYTLAVEEPSGPPLDALVPEEAPPLVAAEAAGGVPSLVQGGPSVLRYALRTPGRAELRFTPSLHPRSAGRSASLRVTLEKEAGAEGEIWKGVVGGESPAREVVVRLPGAPGTLARLGLHVGGEPGEGLVWAVWKAPRVLGDGAAGAIDARHVEAGGTAKVDELRRALSGSSVVLLILDAAGARHFGCYGYERRTTPEIDRIASEGVLFEQAYTPAAYTLAAMASIWTSQYPDQHRNVDPRNASLDRARLTLPDILSAHGIHTAGFVANSMAGPAFGFDRSFAEFREMYSDFGQRADASFYREVLPSWFEANKGRRFFAYVHYREPHSPYDPPAPFDTLFGPDTPVPRERLRDPNWLVAVDNRRTPITPDEVAHVARLYDSNLAFVDQEVGFLRRTLEAQGLWDRTVVIISADHGEAMWEHRHFGHEVQVYEDSIKIPLIVRFPRGTAPAGLRASGLVDLLDLAPTIADVFGLLGKGGSDRTFHGKSLLPMLHGAPGMPAVLSRSRGDRPRHALGDGRYKYIYDAALGADELFDLSSDPGEQANLAELDPLRAALYRQTLQRWVLDLKPDVREGAAEVTLTPQQLENLKALGYVH